MLLCVYYYVTILCTRNIIYDGVYLPGRRVKRNIMSVKRKFSKVILYTRARGTCTYTFSKKMSSVDF